MSENKPKEDTEKSAMEAFLKRLRETPRPPMFNDGKPIRDQGGHIQTPVNK